MERTDRSPRPPIVGRQLAVAGALGLVVAGGAGIAPAAAAPAGGERLGVSYTELFEPLVLQPYAEVEVPVDAEFEVRANVPSAAVLPDGGVVLVEPLLSSAFLVGRDGTTSAVALDVVPTFVVATPGPVVYGLSEVDGSGLDFVAVSLAGDTAGRVVARRPVADPSLYLELPTGPFGNTSAGVVDRVRAPGTVMIGHVDTAGNAASYPAAPLWQIGEDGVVSDGTTQWRLDIERHPGWEQPYAGSSPPAPAAGGGVYWTSVGPPFDGEEFSSSLPVVATLNDGGGGRWHFLPPDWVLVSSDAGGTIFARRVGDRVQLARLDDAITRAGVCDDYVDNDRYPLRRCDSGAAVVALQLALRGSVDPSLEVDGFFGPLTERAVRQVQQQAELTVDGLVGPDTWPAITASTVAGTDDDGSGVVDPWEVNPTQPPAGPPPGRGPFCDGCAIWAVVLAGASDFQDPRLAAAIETASSVGYATGSTGCNAGSAELIGAPPGASTVSVYVASQADAESVSATLADAGIASAAVGLVRTGCLD